MGLVRVDCIVGREGVKLPDIRVSPYFTYSSQFVRKEGAPHSIPVRRQGSSRDGDLCSEEPRESVGKLCSKPRADSSLNSEMKCTMHFYRLRKQLLISIEK